MNSTLRPHFSLREVGSCGFAAPVPANLAKAVNDASDLGCQATHWNLEGFS